jgi:hypothetical protein
LFCKHRVLVIQPLQFSNQRPERLGGRADWSGWRDCMDLLLLCQWFTSCGRCRRLESVS